VISPPTAEELAEAFLVGPEKRTPRQWAILEAAGIVEPRRKGEG
jgi:hypothetical protein